MREMSIDECDDANDVLDAYREALRRGQDKANARAKAAAKREGGRK